uniref:Uncharacterized protein n=1 Tax=Parascaris equorum TaxID=6256 RepID=A0A914RPR2_PAREQ
MSQAEADARAYDARQLEYYRQLQQHRQKYVEQVRLHQLQERERQLRYREELIREEQHGYEQRRQQQEQPPQQQKQEQQQQQEQQEQAQTDNTTYEEGSHIHKPDSSRAHAAEAPVKQAKKLGTEIIRSADKIAEEEEVTRSEVIKAEEKKELLDNGKQVLSLDDYDDEWIEEEYYVDEYGRRLTEEEEASK